MIWASRHFQKANPQNILRKSDLMRILVPWRAFGDLEKCRQLIPKQEAEIISEIEAEREKALAEIHEAYDPLLDPLPDLEKELEQLEVSNFKAWQESPSEKDFYFGSLKTLINEIEKLNQDIASLDKEKKREARERLKKIKVELQTKAKEINTANKERLKQVKRAVKELSKLGLEREQKIAEVDNHADREISLIKNTAADLSNICSDPEETRRFFAVADRAEIEENEFNLNLPRYVDTFEPEEEISIQEAFKDLEGIELAVKNLREKLNELLNSFKVIEK